MDEHGKVKAPVPLKSIVVVLWRQWERQKDSWTVREHVYEIVGGEEVLEEREDVDFT